MSIISTAIANLVSGVSQQPFSLRLPSQAELQENAHSSVVEGLRKRPPTRHKAKIRNTPYTNAEAFTHIINRDAIERYEVVIAENDLKVFDLNGIEKTVAFPNGKDYITNATPSTSLTAITVADYTFIVNRAIATAKSASLSAQRNKEALVWVRQGSYSTNYIVYVTCPDSSTISATFTTSATDASTIRTDGIAQQLVAQLNAAGALAKGVTITQLGSTIHLTTASPTAILVVSTTDSIGDQGIKLVQGSVQKFSDLPARAVGGFRCVIRGDNSSAFDDYYVEFDDVALNYQGVWKESLKGGEQYTMNAATMPHALVRESNGTFTFKQLVWDGRTVGDVASIPFPSFTDKMITDVFFHRNRLGFISDENVIMSRSGEFFNFWRQTATTVLDSDPIDVAVSHVKVSLLRHSVPFNESLLLFSDQTQFSLDNTQLLTPKTIAFNQTTEFESSLLAKPVGAGKNVFFCVNKGGFTGVREYYVDGETKTNDAADVTAHVPKYIPGEVIKLAASSNEDMVIALSRKERNALYVYKYHWNGNEKLQSSWSRWAFPATDTILNVDFIESDIWICVQRADGVYLEVMSVEPGHVDTGATYMTHLDRRVDETQCVVAYNSGTDQTTITLPYTDTNAIQVVTQPTVLAPKKPGTIILHTVIGNVVTVSGNWSGVKLFIGLKYTMRYRFSTFVIREQSSGGGQVTVGEGRLQLRKSAVQYAKTGAFRVEVTPFARSKYTYVFSGRVTGDGSNIIGQVSLSEGRFQFPVLSKNDKVVIDLVNDSFLPSNFLSAEWEGFYSTRSKRV